MREYPKQNQTEQKRNAAKDRVICNGCGKIIAVRQGIPQEGICSVRQMWSYLSGKDGDVDEFVLCESCYDRITESFVVPLTRTEQTEWL